MNVIESPCPGATSVRTQRPQIATQDHEKGTTLDVALPGVTREDLNLTLHQGSLSLEATRRDLAEALIYRLDLKLHSRLQGEASKASLNDGVLRIEIPLKEEALPRQILIQ